MFIGWLYWVTFALGIIPAVLSMVFLRFRIINQALVLSFAFKINLGSFFTFFYFLLLFSMSRGQTNHVPWAD